MVDETLGFLEDNRVTVKPEKDEFAESVAEFMQRNRMRINLPKIATGGATGALCGGLVSSASGGLKPLLHGPTLQTPVSEFISKELRTPDNFVVDLNLGSLHKDMSGGATSSAACNYFTSAYTSGYQVGPSTQFLFCMRFVAKSN